MVALATRPLSTNRMLQVFKEVAENNGETRIGNRVYRERKPVSAPEFPEVFLEMLDDLTAKLEVPRLWEKASDAELFTVYAKDVASLNAYRTSWDAFLTSIVFHSIRIEHDGTATPEQLTQTFAKKMDELRALIPSVEMAMPAPVDFELAERASDAIRSTLVQRVLDGANSLVNGMVSTLDLMHYRRIVGLCQWSERREGVGKYDFYRFVVDQRTVDEKLVNSVQQDKGTYKEDFEARAWTREMVIVRTDTTEFLKRRTHTNQRHQHELIGAKGHFWNDGQVRKPGFVREFLATAPAWIRDKYMRIYDGFMVNETVESRTTAVEDWTERKDEETLVHYEQRTGKLYSPTVAIGHWSLVGWSDRDL